MTKAQEKALRHRLAISEGNELLLRGFIIKEITGSFADTIWQEGWIELKGKAQDAIDMTDTKRHESKLGK